MHRQTRNWSMNFILFGKAFAWALDSNTGHIVWAKTTANPSNDTSPGPVTIVNGVLFAGFVAPNGPLYAMDASTGKILWTYNTAATIYGGVSVSYGCVYVGHGYSVGLARSIQLGPVVDGVGKLRHILRFTGSSAEDRDYYFQE
ncbi:hypothetical protein RND71_002326 [Anisodus tanguticus]|uniref:Pyrrolo-quinoline quinone repeat domain-containing protein n=1 Tax=Anisodus tanguticus TaxID=243964 RepID=A0AAE1T2I5_9SOLA|nr:hypothetical protein RND71_002326 [Anisodus tanguticus]